MITSTLTTKAQTTIPQAVRTALGLREGDRLAYVIQNGQALLTRYEVNEAAEDPFVMFSEWSSDEDSQAYRGL